ncbi:hypothetical protein [Lewinella cohaerens]|uniref:hypothetical protein n=1 Tax=Lewinella cohaerens TaxID=70995 RepID=UPI00037ADD1F|nr:hypothetical protein [Lewinella cohaerens]
MRSITTFLLCFVLPFLAMSQDIIPSSGSDHIQQNFSEQPCPFDTTELVVLPTEWSVYQTLEGTWDGTLDSSRCLSFREMDGDWILDLETLDSTLPLFFRYKMENQETQLPTNGMYRSVGNYWTDAQVILADTCADELCSGLLAIYTVPFSADSTVQRVVRELAGAYKEVSGCWPTENLDSIYLQEYIMKFSFEEEDLSGLTFKPRQFFSDPIYQGPWGGYGQVWAFVFYEYMAIGETTYRGYLRETVFPDDEYYDYYYVQQDGLGFPSFDHYTYVEAIPDFEADTVLDLTIYFESEDELTFQPFTGVRGSLVDGSDTLRHNLTLDYAIPNLCQVFFADLIVPDNTTYLMGSGAFEFANKRSCLMFQTGGTLAIKEEAVFDYGRSGIGVLGLARDGHLDLKQNSTMTIDSKVMLVAYTGSEREQAYAHLAPGSTLRFGPNANLSRTLGNNMYLNVYMNGGTLDDSELSKEERQLIRRIYPQVALPVAGKATVAPNPSSGEIMLVMPESELSGDWPYQVFNELGQLVASGELEALVEGRYRIRPSATMTSGLYRILVQTNDGPVVANWVYEK